MNRIINILFDNEYKIDNILYFHKDTIEAIENLNIEIVSTVDVSILDLYSFDLLFYGFSHIYCYSKGNRYEIKIGANDWTVKQLRKEHKLLKIIRGEIL